jgi:phage terminase large subunit-like protein
MTVPIYSTACPDWESRIIEGRSLVPFEPLFPDSAKEAQRFRHRLKIVDVGDGQQTIGEIGATWAEDLSNAVFGAYDPETGKQMIREAFVLISKKNAKSTEAASIMLTVLKMNWRKSAEILFLAPTKEVADNAYNPARDMVKADPQLDAMMQVQDHIRTIKHLGTGATLKVVAADSNTVGGKKATVVLVDEIHLFGKNPNAEKMLLEATGGLASRPEGFVLYLTTQSDEPPAGVFASKLMYARKVRDGEIDDPQFLPMLYEFPQSYIESKAYLDPANFFMTNPNLGKSASIEFIEREIKSARETGPHKLLIVLSKYLNVEIGLALRTDRWAGADYWLETTDANIAFAWFKEHCEVIDIGIDGGGLDDLLGLAMVGRLTGTDKWVAWMRAWAHPSALQRNLAEKSKMEDFARQGDLILVSRVGDDVTELCDLVEQVYEWGLLDKIGVDPVGIGAIFDELINRGIPEDKIVGISQGWKLGGAIKTTERRLAGGQLAHAEQGLMVWCVSNARVEPRANSILITKAASGSAKIDPLMALFNAVSLMSLNPAAAHRKFQMLVLG